MFYIRPVGPSLHGSGSGADWNNALSGFPASGTAVRDSIYYIAGGVYNNSHVYSFNDAPVGTQRITFRKATLADHGTSVGWQAAYAAQTIWRYSGDQQGNTFTGFTSLRRGYYSFDGGTGRGGGTQEQYGWKWEVDPAVCAANSANRELSMHWLIIDTHDYPSPVPIPGLQFKHIEISMCGVRLQGAARDPPTNTDSAIYQVSRSGMTLDDLLIDHCFFHDISRNGVLITGCNDAVVSNNFFYRIGGSQESKVVTFNNCPSAAKVYSNVFEDFSSAAILFRGGSGHQVYNNVFLFTRPSFDYANTATVVTAYEDVSNVLVAHNAFLAMNGLSSRIRVTSGSTGLQVLNNIWAYNEVNDNTCICGTGSTFSSNYWCNNVRVSNNNQPLDSSNANGQENCANAGPNPFLRYTLGATYDVSDLRLAQNHPADGPAGAVASDFYGNPRNATNPSKGPFEFGTAPPGTASPTSTSPTVTPGSPTKTPTSAPTTPPTSSPTRFPSAAPTPAQTSDSHRFSFPLLLFISANAFLFR